MIGTVSASPVLVYHVNLLIQKAWIKKSSLLGFYKLG